MINSSVNVNRQVDRGILFAICTLFLVLCASSYAHLLGFSRVMAAVFLLLAVSGLHRAQFSLQSLAAAAITSLVVLGHALLNPDLLQGYVTVLIYFGMAFLTHARFGFTETAHGLVKAGKVLTLFSLVLWLPLALIPPLQGFLYSLPAITLGGGDAVKQMVLLGPINFPATILHQSAFRNLGIFTEPGLFAAVLGILLATEYLLTRKGIWSYWVLIAGIASTLSTAGYLFLVVFVVLGYMLDGQAFLGVRAASARTRIGLFILSTFIVGTVAVSISSSSIITRKFDQGAEEFLSTAKRIEDAVDDFRVFRDHPLVGDGLDRVNYDEYLRTRGSSNSVTSILASFGLLGTSALFRSALLRYTRSRWTVVFLLLILLPCWGQKLLLSPLVLFLLVVPTAVDLRALTSDAGRAPKSAAPALA